MKKEGKNKRSSNSKLKEYLLSWRKRLREEREKWRRRISKEGRCKQGFSKRDKELQLRRDFRPRLRSSIQSKVLNWRCRCRERNSKWESVKLKRRDSILKWQENKRDVRWPKDRWPSLLRCRRWCSRTYCTKRSAKSRSNELRLSLRRDNKNSTSKENVL